MWRAEWWLIGAGMAGLLVALVWGIGDSADAAVVTLAVLALVVAVAGVVAWWFEERAAGGLAIPDELHPLPAPPWWLPSTVLGVLVLVVGLTTEVWLVVVGAIIAIAGLVGASRAAFAPPTPLDRRLIRAARDVQQSSGERSYGFVTSLGSESERLVFLRADGTVADLVLPRPGAERAAELAGLRLVDAESQEATALRADPPQWRRMANRVAGY